MRGGRYSGGACGVRLDVRMGTEGDTNGIRRGAEGCASPWGVAKRRMSAHGAEGVGAMVSPGGGRAAL